MSFDILTFLERYQRFPCLWDRANPVFKNRQKREEAEVILLLLFKLENLKALKVKIKAIRGTYNNELRKVKKSVITGSSDVYKPKLHWYNYAHSFLGKNHEDDTQFENNLEKSFSGDSNNEDSTDNFSDDNNTSEIFPSRLPEDDPLPLEDSKKEPIAGMEDGVDEDSRIKTELISTVKKRKLESEIRTATPVTIDKLLEIATNVKQITEFDVFGISVATQLNNMPLLNALQLQVEIQQLIAKRRVKLIEEESNDYI